ncbi:DUF421 domain-containing protein [Saccharomonospora iraqiensis]|uniref:DUF421 domain-containing protein n=1 Tax=Saccharomonospora iraqiensis TaxID=52698 RepID=UPI00022E1603|nr:YetF domain-containing protein [Saccharomonospora iraqiensis]
MVASWQTLALVAVSTVAIYLALIGFSRVAGLRSFSQMTNFDFAATVAFGSITATTATSPDISLAQGALALAVLFATQSLLAYLRKRPRVERLADNRPLLLIQDEHELSENLDRAQMTRNDLYAKLRLAGVTHLDQVDVAVLETTGEVSVLRVDPDGRRVDPRLLANVEGSRTSSTIDPPAPSEAPEDPGAPEVSGSSLGTEHD